MVIIGAHAYMAAMSKSAYEAQIDLAGNRVVPKKKANFTFSDNLSQPIHRWFRYPAGFSATWVRSVIEREKIQGRGTVLDPFAGSGTVLIEAEICHMHSKGIEAHPFISRIARAKLFCRENPYEFHDYASSILNNARLKNNDLNIYPPLINKCFPPEILKRLDSLRESWSEHADNSPLSELSWLALASILRQCSPVGTAQWQYVLPKKTKAKIVDPYKAFNDKIRIMKEDMIMHQQASNGPNAILYNEDARKCASIPNKWADLVITSPPYANNYDYADATRLEMSFFGEIQGWSDLKDTVRKYLIRSCTQHAAPYAKHTQKVLESPDLKPIRDEITEVCSHLSAEKQTHGGKKQYDAMIALYFSDMAQMWNALRRVTSEGSLVCFVIGDSAPYGIYVPVHKWLGDLALSAGFKSYSFDKTRDRNIKWENRKHKVPLCEGNLWIQG